MFAVSHNSVSYVDFISFLSICRKSTFWDKIKMYHPISLQVWKAVD